MESYHVPGLSACIIKGDSVVWNNNYGFMNLEDSIPVSDSTLFNTWCVSKPIIAACVFQLIEDGLLDLDQNINDFMPFQIINPHNNADSISPRMLMAHSSSINGWQLINQMTIGDSPVSLSYFLENYLCVGGEYYSEANYYNTVPGSAFNYDSYATSVSAYLVEPLLGTSFSLYAHNSVLTPLDMNTSAWFLSEINLDNLAIGYKYLGGNFLPQPHYGHPAYPTLTMRSTAHELSNFVIMMLNQGVYKGLNILSSESVDSMTTVQDPTWTNWLGTTGIGLFTRNDFGNRCVWGHDGGGVDGFYYCSHLYFCKEEKSAIVIMSNSYISIHPIVIQMFDYAGLFVSADPASQINNDSFNANWQPAATATGYLLDVAYDEQFTNFVNGFEDHDVGSDTTYTVTGLLFETDYFYRIRAYNASDTGAYSNTVEITTTALDINHTVKDDIKIWSSGNKVYINIPENLISEAAIQIYTHSGKGLGSFRLKEGLNSIPLNVDRQILFVKVKMGNKSFIKKVLVW